MPDNPSPHEKKADQRIEDSSPHGSSSNLPEDAKNARGDAGSDDHKSIFDAQFAKTMDAFGEACKEQGVSTAVAIAIHPDHNMPMIFVKGHEYDIAVLLARVLRNMKGKMFSDLDA